MDPECLINALRSLNGSLFDNIFGTMFDFHVHLGEILSDDPQKQQLNAAEKYYDAEQGRESGNRITPDECFDHNVYRQYQRYQAEQDTECKRYSQGCCGKCEHPFK